MTAPQIPLEADTTGQDKRTGSPVAVPGAKSALLCGVSLTWKIFLWCLALVVFSITLTLIFWRV